MLLKLSFRLLIISWQLTLIYSQHELIIGVITDNDGGLAEKAITTALSSLNTSSLVIKRVKWLRLGDDSTEDDICGQLLTKSNHPSLIIDATNKPLESGSRVASLVKRYVRRSGIPTISTSHALGSAKDEWNDLDDDEKNYLIHVHQPGDVIPLVIKDVVNLYNMSTAVLLHDDSFVLDHKLTHLLDEFYVDYVIKKFDESTLESTLTEMKSSKRHNYFVLGKIRNINKIMDKAATLGLFRFQDSWHMITKGRGQLKCENCTHGSIMFYQPMRVRSIEYEHSPNLFNITNSYRVDAFFFYDLTRLILKSIDEMISHSLWPKQLDFPECGRSMNYEQRFQRSKLNLRYELALDGLNGLFGQFIIHTDNLQNQINDEYDYQEIVLKVNKIELWSFQPFRYLLVGEWIAEPPSGRFIFTGAIEAAKKKHLVIVTIQQPPFVMRWPNETWYGYCIDLLELIVNQLPEEDKFTYELYESPDGKYGDKDMKTGKWDGIMGQMQEKKADIGIGSVTVMAERESIVDFTVPYYDLVGVNILMKKNASPSHMFKFLTVLTNNVWISVLICYLLTSLVMFIFDRISPYSYHNTKGNYPEEEEKRDFNLKECLWFCMTSLTPQGGGEAPINLSSKVVAAIWWFFGFILIATYTANLAAFLTVSRLDSPIDGLDKLAEQYRIRYAPVRNSLSMVYFQRMAYVEKKFYEIWRDMALDDNLDAFEKAKLTVWDYPMTQKYSNIWKQIEITGMPNTFEEGVQRVKRSKSSQEGFALFADATKIRYAIMTNCDLQSIGNEFSRKPIALAVQEGSPLKDKLSSAILKLLNQRQLESLKEKWWNNNPEKKICEDPKKVADGISIRNIGGVFIVISVGVVLACITLIWEHCILKRLRKSSAKVSASFREKWNEEGSSGSPPFYNYPPVYKPRVKTKI